MAQMMNQQHFDSADYVMQKEGKLPDGPATLLKVCSEQPIEKLPVMLQPRQIPPRRMSKLGGAGV